MSTPKTIKRTEKYTFMISYRFKDPTEARMRLNISWNELSKAKVSHLRAVHLKWPGLARWTGSPRWADFYRTFIWYLLPHFSQKVPYVAGKSLLWSGSFQAKIFFNEVPKSCYNFLLLYQIIYYTTSCNFAYMVSDLAKYV